MGVWSFSTLRAVIVIKTNLLSGDTVIQPVDPHLNELAYIIRLIYLVANIGCLLGTWCQDRFCFV